jgi:hypothetical protein
LDGIKLQALTLHYIIFQIFKTWLYGIWHTMVHNYIFNILPIKVWKVWACLISCTIVVKKFSCNSKKVSFIFLIFHLLLSILDVYFNLLSFLFYIFQIYYTFKLSDTIMIVCKIQYYFIYFTNPIRKCPLVDASTKLQMQTKYQRYMVIIVIKIWTLYKFLIIYEQKLCFCAN